MPRVTEKKRVRIDPTCVDSPVYLNWLGVSGGRNYWLFKKKQSHGVSVSITGEYQPYTEDIENAKGFVFNTGVEAVPTITMGARVRSADKVDISKLRHSLCVQLLMNPLTWETDGPIWQVVRPLPGSFQVVETDSTFEVIEVTVTLPFLNIQST
jgi:hypothetical protein